MIVYLIGVFVTWGILKYIDVRRKATQGWDDVTVRVIMSLFSWVGLMVVVVLYTWMVIMVILTDKTVKTKPPKWL